MTVSSRQGTETKGGGYARNTNLICDRCCLRRVALLCAGRQFRGTDGSAPHSERDRANDLPAGRNELPTDADDVRIEVDSLPDGADDLPTVSDEVPCNGHGLPAEPNEMSCHGDPLHG
jgi:hypothetical protein